MDAIKIDEKQMRDAVAEAQATLNRIVEDTRFSQYVQNAVSSQMSLGGALEPSSNSWQFGQ